MTDPLLRVRDLRVTMPTRRGRLPLVDGLDLDVVEGTVSGVAGESGSGKTISMMAILGLLPEGATVSGEARLKGQDLIGSSDAELGRRRGRDVALVMQDPHSSLHPMLSVGSQLTDHVRRHLKVGRRQAKERALELLRLVRIPDPRGSFDAYPHQFSGGMCQRISIAIALACEPSLLIADEPTTGLDVTVQAGILHLLHDLGANSRLGIILITHDLGVMSAIANTITIMYAGKVVEAGPTAEILGSPRHPYTAALLGALPHPDRPEASLQPIPGHLGPPDRWPHGCAFHPRCAHAQERCSLVVPPLVTVGDRSHACVVDPFVSV